MNKKIKKRKKKKKEEEDEKKKIKMQKTKKNRKKKRKEKKKGIKERKNKMKLKENENEKEKEVEEYYQIEDDRTHLPLHTYISFPAPPLYCLSLPLPFSTIVSFSKENSLELISSFSCFLFSKK